MTASRPIKAYTIDEKDQATPVTATSFVLEFPSGQSLEISWEQFPNDPNPATVQNWGGRSPRKEWSREQLQQFTSQVAILPSACNLIRVHPYRSVRPAMDQDKD